MIVRGALVTLCNGPEDVIKMIPIVRKRVASLSQQRVDVATFSATTKRFLLTCSDLKALHLLIMRSKTADTGHNG